MKQIIFVVGHYGSGKSEVAVNLAIHYQIPYLCDLDVINPYFRSRSVNHVLQQHHVQVISSIEPQAIYLDMPLLSQEIYDLFNQSTKRVIYDVGGSDLGAKVIRQFDVQNKPCDLWFVINTFREQTDTPDKIINEINKIQNAANMIVTGLVNNSNLLDDTILADVDNGQAIINIVAQKLNIPVVLTTISKNTVNHEQFLGNKLILQMYLHNHTYIQKGVNDAK